GAWLVDLFVSGIVGEVTSGTHTEQAEADGTVQTTALGTLEVASAGASDLTWDHEATGAIAHIAAAFAPRTEVGLCVTADTDGCDSNCTVEAGWTCAVEGNACVASSCGDDELAGVEECEPGQTTPGAACLSDCTVDSAYACADAVGNARNCVLIEGACNNDGVLDLGEQCDDGNNDLGDGCTPFCKKEPTCRDEFGSYEACTSACGDGVRLLSDLTEQ